MGNEIPDQPAKGLDYCFEKVLQFQRVFKNPTSDKPAPFTEARRAIRAQYLREELEELDSSTAIEDQCDALIDIIYFALGGFAELGVRPHTIFEIVHGANMKKLFPDGEPRHRTSDGKVDKPPSWPGPKEMILREIARQAKFAHDYGAPNDELTDHKKVMRSGAQNPAPIRKHRVARA